MDYSTIIYWKFFSIGLVGGVGLHLVQDWFKDYKADNTITLKKYFEKNSGDIISAVISYQVLVWAWHYGEGIWLINQILPLVNVEPLPQVPINIGTIPLGYFSSSIVNAAILFFTMLGNKLRAAVEGVLNTKIIQKMTKGNKNE